MSPATDSAGQPFEGRSFDAHPFAGDAGGADPTLLAALKAHHAARGEETGRPSLLAEAYVAVIDAMRSVRLLSPLLAEAGEWGATSEGRVVEKTQELSVPHLMGPDGRAVAPVFTSVDALARWNPDARPVPVEASRAALATAADGLQIMVLDPGSEHSVTLRPRAVRALATGDPYLPPFMDPAVVAAVSEGLATAGSVVQKFLVTAGDPEQNMSGPEVVVVIGVEPGLSKETLRPILLAVAQAFGDNPVLQATVDGLGLRVLPA